MLTVLFIQYVYFTLKLPPAVTLPSFTMKSLISNRGPISRRQCYKIVKHFRARYFFPTSDLSRIQNMAGPPRQVLRVYPCAMSYLQHLSVGARMFWRTGSSTVSTLATGSDADPDPWIRIRIKMCRNMPWQKI